MRVYEGNKTQWGMLLLGGVAGRNQPWDGVMHSEGPLYSSTHKGVLFSYLLFKKSYTTTIWQQLQF